MSNIVQYIIVRSDLKSTLSWPLGALIAQCCHATAAVIHLHADDEDTKAYLCDLDNMHKVVLEAKDEAALVKVAEKLKENDIKHKMWIEQPENIPTCIAIKPYVKDNIHKFVKHLKLLK
ncbi:putative peptidyl-tRNA hydrolase PTRHD1 [Anastrepha obliqua]|uniref:putative peptidyl-tRNA hydrolase PTRHD1 n=1 Tax=Anastrepha ludens TaxID=28586 RepID=UPI0023B0DF94|nr:putative peptidyl-tRNA hydrolase PTRHD1 [Anastrepha ludens]XP_054747146.1 putative peptidyl-tRNA hydrolase PTRHD1 [Anastrepha obliqua]